MQQAAHRVQGETGGNQHQPEDGEHDADESGAGGKLLDLVEALDHPDAEQDPRQQQEAARQAEEEERAVLADQLEQAAQDGETLGPDRALGLAVVADGDGDFEDFQSVFMGEELHLGFDGEIGAVEDIGLEGFGGEGAETALRIGGGGAGHATGKEVEEMVTPLAQAGDAAGGLQVARADDDIGFSGEDGLDEEGKLLGEVLAVGVDGDDGIGGELTGFAEAGVEGLAFAEVGGVPDDGGAGQAGDEGGIVGGAIVDYDDGDGMLKYLEDDGTDEALFVIGGDDDIDSELGEIG